MTERFMTERFAYGKEHGHSPNDRDYNSKQQEKDLKRCFKINLPSNEAQLMRSTRYRSLCLQDDTTEQSKRFVTYETGLLSHSELGKEIPLRGAFPIILAIILQPTYTHLL
jgi:hypothetical protein